MKKIWWVFNFLCVCFSTSLLFGVFAISARISASGTSPYPCKDLWAVILTLLLFFLLPSAFRWALFLLYNVFFWQFFFNGNNTLSPCKRSEQGSLLKSGTKKFRPPVYWVPLSVCDSVTLWLCGSFLLFHSTFACRSIHLVSPQPPSFRPHVLPRRYAS